MARPFIIMVGNSQGYNMWNTRGDDYVAIEGEQSYVHREQLKQHIQAKRKPLTHDISDKHEKHNDETVAFNKGVDAALTVLEKAEEINREQSE